jgi:hypothetical protein
VQAALEQRPPRFWALGPLLAQRSAAQPRSHHCDRRESGASGAAARSFKPERPLLGAHLGTVQRESLTENRQARLPGDTRSSDAALARVAIHEPRNTRPGLGEAP